MLSKEDESGNRIAWLIKDANNNYIAETRYTYRGSRLDSAELQDGAARKTGSISYSYNDAGIIQMQEHYNASGQLMRSEHFYWDEGLLQHEERKDANGITQSRISYEYGSQNELLKKTIEAFFGRSEQHIEYEYDFREERTLVID